MAFSYFFEHESWSTLIFRTIECSIGTYVHVHIHIAESVRKLVLKMQGVWLVQCTCMR